MTAGGLWWFRPQAARLDAFVGGGVRGYHLHTRTDGGAGEARFGVNTETSLQLGGVLTGGGELRLGPGGRVLAVEGGGSDLPHLITGDVSTGALGVSLGYRLYF